MAGKNYVFFYDLPDGSGPDVRPSSDDIKATIKEVARVIKEEDPDIVLLQEVDDGARRTDYVDQLKLLLDHLAGIYSCHASAFYWKAFFVPHPKIMGKAGMKLCILSKFRITSAVRHSLPETPANLIVRIFNIKRAILEVRLQFQGEKDFIVMNTHLEAFPEKTDIMKKQVDFVKNLLDKYTAQGFYWIIGGDFNLLPSLKSYLLLENVQRRNYSEKTELTPLIKSYQSIPSGEETESADYSKWFTHYPNDPSVKGPDRTIDYIFFHNKLQIGNHYIRQHDTLKISDHLPVIGEINIQ